MPRPPASALVRPFIALAAACLVVGCGAPRPAAEPAIDVRSDPYAAFPAAPDPVPPERPVTARLTGGTPLPAEVAGFLDRLTTAVERRHWNAVALFLDEDALAAQLALLTGSGLDPRRAAAELLASALGLGGAGAPLRPADSGPDAAPFAGLDLLRTMTVDDVSVAGVGADARVVAAGYVRLEDRSTQRFTLAIRPTARGLRVVVPQG